MFNKITFQFQKVLHRYYKSLEIKDHILLYLFFEITRLCNLYCLHCGSDCRSDIQNGELTTDSWLKIIEYLDKSFSQKPSIVITGGEPLMHPGLKQITGALYEKGFQWSMVTNGQLLSESNWKGFLDHGIKSITISLDGGKEAHEKLRNEKGSFKKAVNAIKLVGKTSAGPDFKDVVTCVHPGNFNNLDLIGQIIIDSGMNSWRIFRIFPSGRVFKHPELNLDFNKTRELLDWVSQNRPYYKKRGISLNYSCERYMNFATDRKVRDFPFFCRAGVNIASILSDGSITGCSNNAAYFYEGNIIRDDFRNLWENGFHQFRNRGWMKTGICTGCKEFKYCLGSSIHLWNDGAQSPAFCYIKNKQKHANSIDF